MMMLILFLLIWMMISMGPMVVEVIWETMVVVEDVEGVVNNNTSHDQGIVATS